MFSKRSVETPRLIMVTTYTNMSNSHFDYNTFSHCRWYSIPTSANMFLSIPPRWLSMVMLSLLQLTQLSSQLSTKISAIKNFQISYIYNENRTTFATFNLVTSPTHVPSEYKHISDSIAVDCMHAWHAYFWDILPTDRQTDRNRWTHNLLAEVIIMFSSKTLVSIYW